LRAPVTTTRPRSDCDL